MSKRELEQPPSTDRSDPAVMRNAAGIAKRRNNKLRAKLPLLYAAGLLKLATAEDVIAGRERMQAATAESFRERAEKEARQIAEWKAEILEAVGDVALARLAEKVAGDRYGSEWMGWLAMRDRIRQRTNEVMPEHADLVLAWLQTWEGDPPTHYELHHKCGDGLTVEEVRAALGWLSDREYVEYHVGRSCTVTGIPGVVTWRIPHTETKENL